MISVKEMPYPEKIEAVVKHTEMYRSVLVKLTEAYLGEIAVDELEQIWLEGSERTPLTATPEEEYRIAYGNWIWTAKSSIRYTRLRLGEEGVRKLEQMLLHALIQQNKGWSLVMLNLVRLVSPELAFKQLAEQLSYNLQWRTAYSLIESSPRRLVLGIDRCRCWSTRDGRGVPGLPRGVPCMGGEPTHGRYEFRAQRVSLHLHRTPAGRGLKLDLHPTPWARARS